MQRPHIGRRVSCRNANEYVCSSRTSIMSATEREGLVPWRPVGYVRTTPVTSEASEPFIMSISNRLCSFQLSVYSSRSFVADVKWNVSPPDTKAALAVPR